MSTVPNLDETPDPRQHRDATHRHRQARAEEARIAQRAIQEEIERMTAKRLELRMGASDTAGRIGLQYSVAENNFIRIVRREATEPSPIEPIARPAPLPPLEIVPQNVPEHQGSSDPPSKWPDVVLWAFTVVIGALIGLGLMTLVGFSWRRDTWVLYAGAVLGVCVLGALKILISTVWRHAGRESALPRAKQHRPWTAVAVTAGGCLLDAHLGALAMREYIRARELTEATVPPYFQLLALALAVTCPLLVATGARSFVLGRHEPNERERIEALRHERERKAEHVHEENHQLAVEHRDSLGKHAETVYGDKVQAHTDAIQLARQADQESEAEWESLKGNPDFRCLQALISQIGVLTQEIEEREVALQGLTATLSEERRRERRADEQGASRKVPWVENRERNQEEDEGASMA